MAKYHLDFSAPLVDMDGLAIRVSVPSEMIQAFQAVAALVPEGQKKELGEKLDTIFGKEMTLSATIISALLSPHEDEKNLGDQERVRRYELARRLSKKGDQQFNSEERDLMKKLVGKRFQGSLVAPMIWEILEDAAKFNPPEAV